MCYNKYDAKRHGKIPISKLGLVCSEADITFSEKYFEIA